MDNSVFNGPRVCFWGCLRKVEYSEETFANLTLEKTSRGLNPKTQICHAEMLTIHSLCYQRDLEHAVALLMKTVSTENTLSKVTALAG